MAKLSLLFANSLATMSGTKKLWLALRIGMILLLAPIVVRLLYTFVVRLTNMSGEELAGLLSQKPTDGVA